MTHYTAEQWLEDLASCGTSNNELVNLVYGDGPLSLWSGMVKEMHEKRPGIQNYLQGIFPTIQWDDWQGMSEQGKIYHPPSLPIDFSMFQRSGLICNPSDQNECLTDYCTIPEGGISELPELEMFKTGFRTQRRCMANIRTSAIAKQVAEYIVNERFQVDENVMRTFYTYAMIRMIGHKFTLEYTLGDNNTIIPIANDNPYNPMQAFRYGYMKQLFPAAGNLNNILPLDMSILDMFGRRLAQASNQNAIAKGPRGEPIFELWTTGDFYKQEIIDNGEQIERMKYTMPAKLFPGWVQAGAVESEIIGNFRITEMDSLPRFAESTEGGLTIVQDYRNVAVDSGTRPLYNYREFANAPFALTVMLGKNVGNILTRPTITTGIEGRPIQPISGDPGADWVYWNHPEIVDGKDCNPELNMPYFKKRYELGFKPKNPDASWGFLHRTKAFRMRPLQNCDLNPVFAITPDKATCNVVQIGCNPHNEVVSNNIIDMSNGLRKVLCQAKSCGSATQHRLTILRENWDSIAPDQNPLQDCACGDTITVLIGDEDGLVVKERAATIVDYYRPKVGFPNPVFVVNLASALAAGECIRSIACRDATPTSSTVVNCVDSSEDDDLSADQVRIVLDGILAGKNVGSSATLTYYDAEGTSLGTKSVTIVSIDNDTTTYVVEAGSGDLSCVEYEDQVTVKLT